MGVVGAVSVAGVQGYGRTTGPRAMRFPLQAFERFARGFEDDYRNFLILSARQVGKTTAFVDLLGLFWPQRYDGITGIMVSDTDANRDYRRDVHGQMLARLPAEWKFPARLDNQMERA